MPLPKYIEKATELIEEMNQAGIDKRLVYHSYAKEYDPTTGNQKLLDEITEHKNLYPCWVLSPANVEGKVTDEKLVDEMTGKAVPAVRIFPKTQNWLLSEWSAGHLLNVLEKRAIPLFIDNEETDYSQLYSLCTKHPDLPVVLTKVPFHLSRQIYALMAETSNLYIETSFFQLYRGIEDICSRFGAQRLIFGSAVPYFSSAPSVMAVKYAQISEADKRMIARENLHRLLKSVL